MIDILGQACTKDGDIEVDFLHHLKNIYSATRKERNFVDNIDWEPISDMNRLLLDKSFDELEVWNALKSFDNNKAPGSDGFTMKFLKKSLDLHED